MLKINPDRPLSTLESQVVELDVCPLCHKKGLDHHDCETVRFRFCDCIIMYILEPDND